MLKTRHNFEEDQQLLLPNERCERIDGFSNNSHETAITRGVVFYVGKWPSHLVTVFMAGSLVFATFVFFAFLTVFFALPTDDECRYDPFSWEISEYHAGNNRGNRRTRNVEIGNSPNVYFLKHENRTWDNKEMCYIEMAAREYPELNVYLINLLTTDPKSNDQFTNLVKRMINNIEPESELRAKLASNNANIRNINVTTERFFNGSRLSNVFKYLNQRMLEMAARSFVLWNFPGVALDPALYSSLKYTQQFLCEKTCTLDQTATMMSNGDLQASGVPCQAFMGFLIDEIAKNAIPNEEYTVAQAINDFCPRQRKCLGVNILDYTAESSQTNGILYCPTVYPDGVPLNLMELWSKEGKNRTTD